jgi:2-iminobutanoate/2-iminopropanoate deaminase
MPRTIIRTSNAPTSPLYNQGVAAGGHLYVSGMVGVDPVTGELAGPDITDQTRQALANCMAILASGGANSDDIAEVGILLADPADFATLNEEWARWFGDDSPARYVAKLGVEHPGVLVSIRMTAFVTAAP